ncbi:MAG TPA: hypothetical protein VG753_02275 [Candidatus Paceibacterota bacterium]|nr:hypothetical protein [Candidatus Paceibacterota bacterium]
MRLRRVLLALGLVFAVFAVITVIAISWNPDSSPTTTVAYSSPPAVVYQPEATQLTSPGTMSNIVPAGPDWTYVGTYVWAWFSDNKILLAAALLVAIGSILIFGVALWHAILIFMGVCLLASLDIRQVLQFLVDSKDWPPGWGFQNVRLGNPVPAGLVALAVIATLGIIVSRRHPARAAFCIAASFILLAWAWQFIYPGLLQVGPTLHEIGGSLQLPGSPSTASLTETPPSTDAVYESPESSTQGCGPFDIVVGPTPGPAYPLVTEACPHITWHVPIGETVEVYDADGNWLTNDESGQFHDLRGRSPAKFAAVGSDSVEVTGHTW